MSWLDLIRPAPQGAWSHIWDPAPSASLGPEGNRGLPRGPGAQGGGAGRGGGRVQSPGRPGCRGMKPPPSPAQAFKYGRGPGTRVAAGGAVCGACGLGGRRCPRERDLHRRCAPALVSTDPRGVSLSRGPGVRAVRDRSPFVGGLPTAPSWSSFSGPAGITSCACRRSAEPGF